MHGQEDAEAAKAGHRADLHGEQGYQSLVAAEKKSSCAVSRTSIPLTSMEVIALYHQHDTHGG